MFTTQVHLWAVLVSVVAYSLIGWIWYGPLFGKQWMAAMKISKEGMSGSMMPMLYGVIVSVFKAYFLDRVVTLTGVSTVFGAMVSAFWIWFGFILTYGLILHIYERRSNALTTIEQGFELVWFLVAGALIGWAM